ncbi:DUF3048 domain-containing protein [Paenibacillus validus]|uniref:DUF3048 domain-containing protein n=1 Tax=Paenibacillus TaxID=44249 RepID=UPI0006D28951|nr:MULTISPECIES: DUF3048 domain-containing protein [Paenibacillus]MED4603444.1 DUF3048 domain-containing protein [Paenibacillus validus]MED4609242.1 DUF3048 domain-containing protein [Paenibacillus validus]
MDKRSADREKAWQRKTGWKRKGGFALLACAMALSAAGCNADDGATTVPEAAETAKPVLKQEEPPAPAPKAAYLAPLTGVETAEKNESRPVMVVINNAPQARPQSGLLQADLLYEVLAEGEITRLIALFQSSAFTGDIGPVRSIRPYFISIGKSYGAIQVHAGGSPDGYETISRERIENLDEITNAGPYFWREKSRKAPHNLYTNLTNIRDGAGKRGLKDQGPTAPVYSFAKPESGAVETMGSGAKEARKVDVTFLVKSYRVSYEYDEAARNYKRSINGSAHSDLNNGETLTATNVVVLGAVHRILDNEGRRDVKLMGQGTAVLFQRGMAKSVEWKRERENDPIRLYDQGREVSLLPGQTHMLIVPNTPTFEEHVVY